MILNYILGYFRELIYIKKISSLAASKIGMKKKRIPKEMYPCLGRRLFTPHCVSVHESDVMDNLTRLAQYLVSNIRQTDICFIKMCTQYMYNKIKTVKVVRVVNDRIVCSQMYLLQNGSTWR